MTTLLIAKLIKRVLIIFRPMKRPRKVIFGLFPYFRNNVKIRPDAAIISRLNFNSFCELFDQELSFLKSRDQLPLSYFVRSIQGPVM